MWLWLWWSWLVQLVWFVRDSCCDSLRCWHKNPTSEEKAPPASLEILPLLPPPPPLPPPPQQQQQQQQPLTLRSTGDTMKYATFESSIDLPFYYSLAQHKIDYDKLDDSPRKVLGQYGPGDLHMLITEGALTADDVAKTACRAEGMVKNFNTIEEFRKADKPVMMKRAAQTIWDAILDGSIYSCPSLLSSFIILCYADLKKYKFHHLFGFPALASTPPWSLASPIEKLDSHQTSSLVDSVNTWQYSVDSRQRGFFLVKREYGAWKIGALEEFERDFFQEIDEEDRFVAFVDPSTYADNAGWPLRNLLVLVRKRWGWKSVRILCYRDSNSARFEPRSLLFNLVLGEKGLETSVEDLDLGDECPKPVGWEKTGENRFAIRVANLTSHMNTKKQADINVDLNLKLMKWRVAPDLNLDTIKSTRCLLLGAGTLGSYVARILLGWGVHKITFVDSGVVSFSNPVRQPLFTFQDCEGGSTQKAPRAAEALREIYPGVDATGITMEVPMAAHPFSDSEEPTVKANYTQLKTLMENHDAIFLLMDTRESRWLPTVMGKSMGKIVMNAALGFDTFVVMRHGTRITPEQQEQGAEELGCYYCNDVVAPGDSLTDRTLDQQCTVTRPGIAPLASSLLVETLVSLLQHPQGPAAPAPTSSDSSQRGENPLGLVPHQIRGFLATFQNMLLKGTAYDCCSACSKPVLEGYEEGGWEFVKKALCEKGFVEEISGLAEVQRRAEEVVGGEDWAESGEEEGWGVEFGGKEVRVGSGV